MPCKICGSDKTELSFTLPKFDLYTCRECSHFFSVLKVNSEQYNSNYFTSDHKDYFEKPDTAFFQKEHELIQQYLNTSNQRNLLDVGTGIGALPRYFNALGYDAWGIDTSVDSIKHGKENLKTPQLKTISIEEFTPPQPFDIVISNHVIEHVPDPLSFLHAIHQVLVKNGLFLCVTVESDSLIFSLSKLIYKMTGGRKYKSLERICDVHHLHHFNRYSLEHALKKNGFAILKRFPVLLPVDMISLNFQQRLVMRTIYPIIRVLDSCFWQGLVCRKI